MIKEPLTAKIVEIREEGISLREFQEVVHNHAKVTLSRESRLRVEQSHTFLEEVIARKQVVYGVNTGFGKLSTVILPEDKTHELQVNLIRSHACAVGEPYSEDIVRAMMLLRLVSLTRGHSGVRVDVVETLMECLNQGVHPVIPEQGSLGASGDLAPLAHLALVLMGEGEAILNGQRMSGMAALSETHITPIQLTAKEGLALINGTQAMTSVGLLAHEKSRYLLCAANHAAMLTMQALDGIIDAFSAGIQRIRPYPEQAAIAAEFRAHLDGSGLISPATEHKVQDAYSLRCIPQVHGASLRALNHVLDTLEIEMNSVTDNPLLFPEEDAVYSGGNFHGQPVALVMDYLKIAVSELANISERRTERLVNPHLNGGLPPFLAPEAGLTSGMMILQYVAASLVSENKVLAHPASVDSIPSSGNQEDHVSMGTTSARQALQMVKNSARVVAIELICAAQALEWKDKSQLSKSGQKVMAWVRDRVPPYTGDRSYSAEIERIAESVLAGEFEALFEN